MKKTILFTAILAVILTACGSKAEAPRTTTAAETMTSEIEMQGKDSDAEESSLSKEQNANNNTQEKEVAEETDEDPKIIADNAAGLTPQVSGPPYVYEVGGVSLNCNINIYDYIYEKNGFQWVDIPKMAEDNGYEAEADWQVQTSWSGRAICDTDDGVIIITVKKGTTKVNDSYRNVDALSVRLFASREDSKAICGYTLVKKGSDGYDYRITNMANYGITIDQIKVVAYMLSVSRQEGPQLDADPLASLEYIP